MERLKVVSPAGQTSCDVSIVMPCLNEARSIPICIANARAALAEMSDKLGLSGEIIVADNGSKDGSPRLARALGARVVDVAPRGYGAALMAGFREAQGRYLVMGDADGSYDFRDAVEMVRKLSDGADLCIGSRFAGGIEPGAMPWKNRYIGNPALTFVLNLFYRANVADAHCGLRALTKDSFERLRLSGSGMEFASEMIIKAALKKERIVEAPAKLRKDSRERAPHLRPWRDGWRHVRYLLMLSPAWVFALPAAIAALAALAIFACATAAWLQGGWENSHFGNYWVILAGSLLGLSHIGFLFAASTYLYGRRAGYRPKSGRLDAFSNWITLETMLIIGVALIAAGLALLVGVLGYWSQHHFSAIRSALPAAAAAALLVIGAQNALGGFLLAVVNGNEAEFLKRETSPRAEPRESTLATTSETFAQSDPQSSRGLEKPDFAAPRGAAQTESGLRRLRPRPMDTDWLLLRRMRASIERFAAQAARAGDTAIDFGAGSEPYRPIFEALGVAYRAADFGGADIEIDASGSVGAADGVADLVLSFQVLEHVRDVGKYLSEARRVLRDEGALLLSTHGAWLYHPHPEDHRRWTREGLIAELKSNGFETAECAPLLGPLGWTTLLRLTMASHALRRIPLIGKPAAAVLALAMNLRGIVEEAVTPDWATRDNACVYLVLCRKSGPCA
jgi:glycosyltransferase involved in cell wall biosynthesis/SAM-dependent methyltransferase